MFAAAAGASLAAALPAHASIADMTCSLPSSQVTDFSPALTGSEKAKVSGTLSCAGMLTAMPVTSKITWSDGRASTYSGNRVSVVQGAELVTSTTGTVTDGLFKGDSFVQTQVTPALTIAACDLGEGTITTLTSNRDRGDHQHLTRLRADQVEAG